MAAIEIVPFELAQVARERAGFRRFGKGRHSARLNFGNCLSYALDHHPGEPLLFTGETFARTDLAAALPPT